MDHALLRQFVAAARYLHFAHAARALGIPRSTVIASIRKMEAQLGYELFATDATTTQLTPAGEAFLIDAERQLDKSARSAGAAAGEAGGQGEGTEGKGPPPRREGREEAGAHAPGALTLHSRAEFRVLHRMA